MSSKEKGSIHIPLLVAIFALLFVASVIPIKRSYSDGKSDVAGVYLAKGEASNSTEMKDDDFNIVTSGFQTALVNKRVGALSSFPLSINPKTRELSVTTPSGVKIVTVLPQKAVDNMLAAHVMTDVEGVKVNNDLASVPNLVNLEIENGVLGYKIKGTKTHKLFGLIPIKTGVETFVSAENGQVVTSTDSILGRILNRIAP